MGTTKDDIVRESADGAVDHRWRRALVLLGVIIALLLATLVTAGTIALRDYRSSAQDGTNLAREVQAACADPTQAAELGSVCGTADDVVNAAPASVKGDKGDPGPTGPQGPTGPAPSEAQVAQAVALYCSGGACDGQDGSNATQAQVAQAVALFCDARGECRGPGGAAGADGQDGAAGAQGEQGPPPTTAQIQTAVATYCSSRNNCEGPRGEAGPQGPQGDKGEQGDPGTPGVVNVVDNCGAAPEGQVIANVGAEYESASQTIVITCTFKDDQTGILPGNGGTQ